MNIAATLLLADDRWNMHGDLDAGWWIAMMVGMAIFWIVVILAIAWFARGAFGEWRGGRSETPMEILERRFAEGEISVDDYHERQAVIIAGARHRHEADVEEASVGRDVPQ